MPIARKVASRGLLRTFLVVSGVLLGVGSLWVGSAAASKPRLILSEGKGGPVLTAPIQIGLEFYEISGPGCSQAPGGAEKLLNNSAATVKVTLSDPMYCGIDFGPEYVTGELKSLTLTSKGTGTLAAKLDFPSDSHTCHYKATKLLASFSLPTSLEEVHFSGTGKRVAPSPASCATTEHVEIGLRFFTFANFVEGPVLYAET